MLTKEVLWCSSVTWLAKSWNRVRFPASVECEGVSRRFRTKYNEKNNNNKQSLRSNTKVYDGKTHYTVSQNSDITAPSGREMYHLQFSL